MERVSERKVALVTGNAQGIGRGISIALAEAGINIIGNHADSRIEAEARAENTRRGIEVLGVRATSVVADITTTAGREMLLKAVLADYPQGINYLILNAAGGLEQGKPADWAENINVHSQLALVDTFKPYILKGGVVMYVTSLWAHRYGEVEQLPGYEPVARTKHMAEMALRGRIDELSERNIRLLILCGYLIPGTRAFDIFRDMDEKAVAALEKTAEGGRLPTIHDMGNAARALIISDQPSGSIAFIGGTYAEPLKERRRVILNTNEIKQMLPMYGESKLRIDEFASGETAGTSTSEYILKTGEFGKEDNRFDKCEIGENKGIVRRTTSEEETEGHFVINGKKEPIYRGVDLIKDAISAYKQTWLALHHDANQFVVTGAKGFTFPEMVFPANRLAYEVDTRTGDCVVKVGDIIVAEVRGIQGAEGVEDDYYHREELIEAAAQSLILTWRTMHPNLSDGVPVFRGGDDFSFDSRRKLVPGDKISLQTVITYEGANTVKGNTVVRLGDEELGRINGVEGQVLPNYDIVQAVIRRKKYARQVGTNKALAAENL